MRIEQENHTTHASCNIINNADLHTSETLRDVSPCDGAQPYHSRPTRLATLAKCSNASGAAESARRNGAAHHSTTSSSGAPIFIASLLDDVVTEMLCSAHLASWCAMRACTQECLLGSLAHAFSARDVRLDDLSAQVLRNVHLGTGCII